MSLTLHYHPLASFCWKVLIALYENGTPFKPHLVDLGDPEAAAAFKALWPIRKFPVLEDDATGSMIPESTTIIEYLDQHYPGQHAAHSGRPRRGAQRPLHRPALRSLRASADAEDHDRPAAAGRQERSARRRGGQSHLAHRARHPREGHGHQNLGHGRGVHACRLRGAARRCSTATWRCRSRLRTRTSPPTWRACSSGHPSRAC